MRLRKVSSHFITTLMLCLVTSAFGDSGGPYAGVPDASAAERGPVFPISQMAKPLRHFITHVPKLTWNRSINEPDGFTFEPIVGYHASLTALGSVGGHHMLCIRYTSDARIDQGLDYADVILILARKHDGEAGPETCVPVFYYSGGPGTYNLTAESLENERYGGFKVTGFISGTGGFRDETFIRYQDGKFVRFTPPAKLKN